MQTKCTLDASTRNAATVKNVSQSAYVMVQNPSYDYAGVLFKARNGQLVSIYREGLSHATDRGRIVMRKSGDGIHWSSAQLVLQDPVYDVRGPYGGRVPSGDLVLFFSTYDYQKLLPVQEYFMRSSDDGETWSTPTLVPGRSYGYGQIVDFGDRIGIVTAVGTAPNRHIFLQFSSDDGRTWDSAVRVPSPYEEVAFTWLGDKKILGFARQDGGTGAILRLYSGNMGKTWNVAETSLKPKLMEESSQRSSDAIPQSVSPFVVRPFADDDSIELWYMERNETMENGKNVGKGFLRSVVLDPTRAISAPDCLPDSVVRNQTSWDSGYPWMAQLGDNKYLVQFSAPAGNYHNLHLVPGEYERASALARARARRAAETPCGG